MRCVLYHPSAKTGQVLLDPEVSYHLASLEKRSTLFKLVSDNRSATGPDWSSYLYFVGGHDWNVAELDYETGLAFGHADLSMGYPEWEYFDLVEMEKTIAHEVIVIERDLHFRPQTAKELGIA